MASGSTASRPLTAADSAETPGSRPGAATERAISSGSAAAVTVSSLVNITMPSTTCRISRTFPGHGLDAQELGDPPTLLLTLGFDRAPRPSSRAPEQGGRARRTDPWLAAGPELCRQGAVVGQRRRDAHDAVPAAAAQQPSHAVPPLAPHDETPLADRDLAPSARHADRLAGHDVVRAVFPDRQGHLVRLGAGQVYHALPRASYGLDVGHRDGPEPRARAADQRGREPDDDDSGENGPERSRAVRCHRLSPLVRVNNHEISQLWRRGGQP